MIAPMITTAATTIVSRSRALGSTGVASASGDWLTPYTVSKARTPYRIGMLSPWQARSTPSGHATPSRRRARSRSRARRSSPPRSRSPTPRGSRRSRSGRLATKLEARPMSLYSHIERKGDLIDLMVDEVMGGAVLPEPLPEDWREALRQIAQRTRESTRAHPWMIAAAFRRPFIGPNALRHFDQSLGAVASLPLPPERKRAVLLAVDTYTLGFVRWEVISKSRHGDGDGADASCAADPDRRPERRGDRHLRRRPGGERQVPPPGRARRQEEDEPRGQGRGVRGRPRLAAGRHRGRGRRLAVS